MPYGDTGPFVSRTWAFCQLATYMTALANTAPPRPHASGGESCDCTGPCWLTTRMFGVTGIRVSREALSSLTLLRRAAIALDVVRRATTRCGLHCVCESRVHCDGARARSGGRPQPH